MTDIIDGWRLEFEYDSFWVNWKATYKNNPDIFKRSRNIPMNFSSESFDQELAKAKKELLTEVEIINKNLTKIEGNEASN